MINSRGIKRGAVNAGINMWAAKTLADSNLGNNFHNWKYISWLIAR